MADLSLHDPQDTCPFNSHIEYNKAMREVYGDQFDKVTADEFAELQSQAICPVHAPGALTGVPIERELPETMTGLSPRPTPTKNGLPPRPPIENDSGAVGQVAGQTDQWKVVPMPDLGTVPQDTDTVAAPPTPPPVPVKAATSPVLIVSSVVAAVGVLTILGIIISRK